MPDTWGPFETERDARTAALRHVEPESGWSILRAPQNRELLTGACKTAGVTLGAFDTRILDWVAGTFEDSACAVIAGLILRAAASSGEDEDA
jgi:hypothetical protein